MERIVIIDHACHQVFIEDIPEDILNGNYGGEEEAYIKDNYTFDGEWSWDYVTYITYVTEDGDYELEPSDLI
jgi:hypothetical protein